MARNYDHGEAPLIHTNTKSWRTSLIRILGVDRNFTWLSKALNSQIATKLM